MKYRIRGGYLTISAENAEEGNMLQKMADGLRDESDGCDYTLREVEAVLGPPERVSITYRIEKIPHESERVFIRKKLP
jgi:hypothetical protein